MSLTDNPSTMLCSTPQCLVVPEVRGSFDRLELLFCTLSFRIYRLPLPPATYRLIRAAVDWMRTLKACMKTSKNIFSLVQLHFSSFWASCAKFSHVWTMRQHHSRHSDSGMNGHFRLAPSESKQQYLGRPYSDKYGLLSFLSISWGQGVVIGCRNWNIS